jgi:hypothetical protein
MKLLGAERYRPIVDNPDAVGTVSSLLNPRFSLWLQGVPDEWACCAELAMRSVRRKPKPSSNATSK